MIRIMTATRPKVITITVDGELSGEYVDAVETCATHAIATRRPTHLFLRDVSTIDEGGRALLVRLAAKGVSTIDEGGRALLVRLAAKGVRLRASGVYCSY